jgi:hypothetical protein
MSRNTVDASIELANEFEIPLALVASRRQIEARGLGGGYVNRWSTEAFACYVRERDARGLVVIERDHGGPWQGSQATEQNLGHVEAMDRAKQSFMVDIASGFDLIHIDPNKEGWSDGSVDLRTFTERTIELLDFCVDVSRTCRRSVPPAFEIGTDQGAVAAASPDQFEEMCHRVQGHCATSGIPPPDFIVVPTGTEVKERRNIGTLEQQLGRHGNLPKPVTRMVDFCHAQGALAKEHSADYLADSTLRWHASGPIDAINIAPQLGVSESFRFVELLQKHHLNGLLDRFVSLSLASGDGQRWLLPGTSASELERAIIGGHYVFGTEAFAQIKSEAAAGCRRGAEQLDQDLRDVVRQEILRHSRLLSIASGPLNPQSDRLAG